MGQVSKVSCVLDFPPSSILPVLLVNTPEQKKNKGEQVLIIVSVFFFFFYHVQVKQCKQESTV